MNKIYRLKFSKRLNQLIVVSEIATGHDRNSGSNEQVQVSSSSTVGKLLKLRPLSALISVLSFGILAPSAMASGLVGMDVVHGSASMQVNGKETLITNSPDAIINWKQFNINTDELVKFIQENSNSAVFNRVTGDQLSQLKGALTSNGHVFLINPNGIVFGKDAVIDTAGFTASTLNISDENLKARNFVFEQAKDKAMAQIINNGLITVSKNGSVTLIGGNVQNNGIVKVEDGNVILAAGQKVVVSDIVNPTITYSVVAPQNKALNLGSVFAKNGRIEMHGSAVENHGVLNADSVHKDKSGTIILSAKTGEATIGGTISAKNVNGKAGSLTITGQTVTLKNGAKVKLTGKQGGTAYIGGDEAGKGTIQLAKATHIQKGVTVNVSGSEKGGKAIVWGDRAQIDGTILATGKDKANGGFVETSGHYLGVSKDAQVRAKQWLLDPYNVRIVSTGSESNITKKPLVTITGDDAVILNSTIENALKAGVDVNISTAGPGSQDGTLTVEANIVKDSGADDANLTMFANSTFTQNAGTTISSSSGKLNLNVTAGNLTLNGTINTNEGALMLNTTGNVGLHGANIAGNGTIQMADNSRGGSTLFIVDNSTLKGQGNGLNLNVSAGTSASNTPVFNATWKGNITTDGEVRFNRAGGAGIGTILGHHNWMANLTVNSGNFTLSDITPGGGYPGSEVPAVLNISEDVVFNTTAGSNVNFTIKNYGATTDSPTIVLEGNVTTTGDGGVSINVPTSAYATGGIVVNSSSLTSQGNSTLNLKAITSSRPAVVINNDITLDAQNNSSIKLNGIISSATSVVAKANVTLKGNNVSLVSEGASNGKVSILGNVVSEASNAVISGEHSSLFNGTVTVNSGNFTASSRSSQTPPGIVSFNQSVNVASGANMTVNASGNKGTILLNSSVNSEGNLSLIATNNGLIEQAQGTVMNLTGPQSNLSATNVTLDSVNSNQSVNITARNTAKFGGNFNQTGGMLNITAATVTARDANGITFNGTDQSTINIKTNTLNTTTGNVNLHNYTKSEISNRDDSSTLTVSGTNALNLNGSNTTFNTTANGALLINTNVNADSNLNITGNI